MFNYSAKINGQFYYGVQYWRFGKNEAVGYLIVRPNGDLVPRREAEPALKLLGGYNVCAHLWTQDVAVEKNKPVSMYVDKLRYLQALEPAYKNLMSEALHKEVKDFMEMCEYMAKSRDRISEVFEKGATVHRKMDQRGYLIPEDHETFLKLLYEVNYISYRGLRMQTELWDSVERLINFFQGVEKASYSSLETSRKNLINQLKIYRQNKLKTVAAKSIRTYEYFDPAKHESYDSAEHLAESFRKHDEVLYQKLGMSRLRNP